MLGERMAPTDDPADEAAVASQTERRAASTSSPLGAYERTCGRNAVMIRYETSTMSNE